MATAHGASMLYAVIVCLLSAVCLCQNGDIISSDELFEREPLPVQLGHGGAVETIQAGGGGASGDNRHDAILGQPTVVCEYDRIRVMLHMRRPFWGRLYAKGRARADKCSRHFSAAGTMRPVLDLRLSDCGMQRERRVAPVPGLMQSVIVITSFHNLFVTKYDRAYMVQCYYEQQDFRTVTGAVAVNEVIALTLPVSRAASTRCAYDVRVGGIDGETARVAEVGETLYHTWACTGPPDLSILVKNCLVGSGMGDEVAVIDGDGCAVDPSIVPELSYGGSGRFAWVAADAFKFSDTNTVAFSCTIQLCSEMAGDTSCFDMTPPRCREPVVTADSQGIGGDLARLGRNIARELSDRQLETLQSTGRPHGHTGKEQAQRQAHEHAAPANDDRPSASIAGFMKLQLLSKPNGTEHTEVGAPSLSMDGRQSAPTGGDSSLWLYDEVDVHAPTLHVLEPQLLNHRASMESLQQRKGEQLADNGTNSSREHQPPSHSALAGDTAPRLDVSRAPQPQQLWGSQQVCMSHSWFAALMITTFLLIATMLLVSITLLARQLRADRRRHADATHVTPGVELCHGDAVFDSPCGGGSGAVSKSTFSASRWRWPLACELPAAIPRIAGGRDRHARV